MHIDIDACTHVYMHTIHTCIHTYIYSCIHIHLYTVIYIDIFWHTYTYMYTYIHTYVHTYRCICMYACICMCVYVCVYVCVCLCMHTCICIGGNCWVELFGGIVQGELSYTCTNAIKLSQISATWSAMDIYVAPLHGRFGVDLNRMHCGNQSVC